MTEPRAFCFGYFRREPTVGFSAFEKGLESSQSQIQDMEQIFNYVIFRR